MRDWTRECKSDGGVLLTHHSIWNHMVQLLVMCVQKGCTTHICHQCCQFQRKCIQINMFQRTHIRITTNELIEQTNKLTNIIYFLLSYAIPLVARNLFPALGRLALLHCATAATVVPLQPGPASNKSVSSIDFGCSSTHSVSVCVCCVRIVFCLARFPL